MVINGSMHSRKYVEQTHTCTVPPNVKLRPMRQIFFDFVKACERISLCFVGQIVIKIDHVLL